MMKYYGLICFKANITALITVVAFVKYTLIIYRYMPIKYSLWLQSLPGPLSEELITMYTAFIIRKPDVYNQKWVGNKRQTSDNNY